jgi:type I restriction enzyme R subunit
MPKQNSEQIARDKIDAMLMASGWMVQSKKELNLNAGLGVAIREYQTDVGPADYVLFVNQKMNPAKKMEFDAVVANHRVSALV